MEREATNKIYIVHQHCIYEYYVLRLIRFDHLPHILRVLKQQKVHFLKYIFIHFSWMYFNMAPAIINSDSLGNGLAKLTDRSSISASMREKLKSIYRYLVNISVNALQAAV